MAGLLPNYILREFDNTGKLLSGGKIYFYESGTYTAKATYTDYTLTVAHTNPVILDASGAADIWLSNGAYRVYITDANGVQIRPAIDGITAAGSGASSIVFTQVSLYADLRTLTTTPDLVYVSGRTVEGDGGQGFFQLLPASSLSDDDGVILTSGTGVYKRIFDGFINPTWYGVKYNVNIDQKLNLDHALAGSIQHNFPVLVTDRVFLAQNITVPNNAMLQCTIDGYFNASGAITMAFATGSKFESIGVAFGSNINPTFGNYVCDYLHLSWFGGTIDYDRWTKAIASTTNQYKLNVDVNTSISQNVIIPGNFAVDFIGGALITFTGNANLAINNLVYTGIGQIVSYGNISYLGTITLNVPSKLEWFGGVIGSSHALDNSIAFKACVLSGSIQLLKNNYYYVKSTGSPYTVANGLVLVGDIGATLELDQPFTVGALTIKDATIIGTATSITCSFTNITDTLMNTIPVISASGSSVLRSTIYNVTYLAQSSGSKFVNFTGTIMGNIDTTSFTLYATFSTSNNITIDSCTFTKISGPPILMSVAENTTLYFDTCHFATNDLLFYSIDTNTSVFINACTSSNNWTNPLTNGYAYVNLIACGLVNNSTAYAIDRYKCYEDLINLSPSYGTYVATSSATNWLGIGAVTSDGTYLSINGNITLSADWKNTNTIRFAGPSDDSIWQMQALFRWGGQIKTTVIYPSGAAPDINTKLAITFAMPGWSKETTWPPNDTPNGYYIHDNVLGVNNVMSLPAINGAKAILYTNIWGGQVDLLGDSTNSNPLKDVWGDYLNTRTLLVKYYRLPRIVIYNQGSGIIPVGTKFKIELIPSVPSSRDQYVRFWPQSYWVAYFNPAGAPLYSNVRTSLGTPYSMGFTQIKTPYEFRDVDDTGLQVSLSRRTSAVASGSPIDLPVTAWFGANSLNNGYS